MINLSKVTLAIDVTPILPGGENGGAKIFVLELISGLARMASNAELILLTQAASHDELSHLDSSNVRRLMVTGSANSEGCQARAKRDYASLKSRFPFFLRRRLAQSAYRINALFKRAGCRRVLQQIGANLLFCPFTAPVFFDRRIPTVCTVYDLQFATYPHFFEPEDFAYRKSTIWDACRKATMLIAISHYSRKSTIAYCNLAPNRVKTIHLRMSQRTVFSSNNSFSDILNRLKLSPSRYLLYPANFWKHKNHEMLLAAFGMACAIGMPQDIKLVFTGEPNSRKVYLQNAAEAFGLSNRIVFSGYLSTSDLSLLLKSAGALVFPSLYEGFGLPVLEAMAAGIPVACSNVTSLPEVAGKAAIYFDPKKPIDIANMLVSLVTDEPLRNTLIENGYRQADLFCDTDRMVSEYWNIFKILLSRR